ncbi:D-ribose pyranase [Alicyclobacillaceae bacterium I2511]|nr:D-ribose pyranase [Alicyclobacillaceae bacterium I2511]
MKKSGVLNHSLSQVIAQLGHGQTIVIADYGLPVPKGVPMIDLAVRNGLPRLTDVLQTVLEELAVEGATVANELSAAHPAFYDSLVQMIGSPVHQISHEDLKRQLGEAFAVVRTGEFTSYSNVILKSGVIF